VRTIALGLVLRAATKGEVHRRATEAIRAVVFNFVIDNINTPLRGKKMPRGVSEFDRVEVL
jgi:hypothetical protein